MTTRFVLRFVFRFLRPSEASDDAVVDRLLLLALCQLCLGCIVEAVFVLLESGLLLLGSSSCSEGDSPFLSFASMALSCTKRPRAGLSLAVVLRLTWLAMLPVRLTGTLPSMTLAAGGG